MKWADVVLQDVLIRKVETNIYVIDVLHEGGMDGQVRFVQIDECCARSRYQGQGQVITSHNICGM